MVGLSSVYLPSGAFNAPQGRSAPTAKVHLAQSRSCSSPRSEGLSVVSADGRGRCSAAQATGSTG